MEEVLERQRGPEGLPRGVSMQGACCASWRLARLHRVVSTGGSRDPKIGLSICDFQVPLFSLGL